MNVLQPAAKIYAAESQASSDDFIRVFHRWIQSGRLPEVLMIDVADYSHVHHGPGVMLVTHQGHYRVDDARGELGLEYERKRDLAGDRRTRLRTVIRQALNACHLLESDSALDGAVRFRTDRVLFRIADRLLAPPGDATFDVWEPELTRLVEELYGTPPAGLEQNRDPRGSFAVRIRTATDLPAGTLLERLGTVGRGEFVS